MKNLKTNLKSLKGITLVSLVVTIIILLILSGITISTLMGENGLFARVKKSKEKYSISEAKEKLELAISTLQIEQEGNGENLKKEDLPKINNDEIDVRDTSNFPVKVICNNYEFNIDSNFVISYVGIANETIVTYTTDPEGYTNKNEVKILIKIKNSKGIKTIEYPNDNDKLLANGQTEVGFDYKVTANGTYTFKIVDNDNIETTKDIVIEKIDTVVPKDFTPSIENIKSTAFTVVANVEDGDETDTSIKSGIEKYEIFVNNTKYESSQKIFKVTGLTKKTSYSVYVKAYDRAGNFKQSSTITVTTTEGVYPTLTLNGVIIPDDGLTEDALAEKAYDNNYTTYADCDTDNSYLNKLMIDPACCGKYITLYTWTADGSSYGCMAMFSSTQINALIKFDYLYRLSENKTFGTKTAKSVKIPQNTKMISLLDGTFASVPFYVYEVKCTDEDLSCQEF